MSLYRRLFRLYSHSVRVKVFQNARQSSRQNEILMTLLKTNGRLGSSAPLGRQLTSITRTIRGQMPGPIKIMTIPILAGTGACR